ncbi:STAS domain-containing protein [Thiomicrorhabdus sp.]|uniref:STAS domain-containing protein n=1 Tax=Thiomicrorhabdus sp. TaxID=2039724 RepID=UPI0029C8DF55|nr:STAS domain-containing protein [Thiomicrorhabdus sp.]
MQIEWMPQSKTVIMPEEVTLKTLPALLKANKGWRDMTVETVDFSKVVRADSAVLALLLVWRAGVAQPLQMQAFPEQLATLVGLYDLDDVLSLALQE